MRSLLIAATALALAVSAVPSVDHMSNFEAFKAKFNRQYSSPVEESKRFRIFVENMESAAAIQAKNPLATFGAGPYADMSAVEFKSRHNAEKLYAKLSREAKDFEHPTEAEVLAAAGKSQDWRPKGAVTHVKNQGDCGSCWSFSTTGGVEGQWFLAGNTLTSLSEQLFVSCDTTDDACKGGLMDNAFKWAINDNGGNLVTAASYPYVSGDGIVPSCDNTGKTFGAHITGYKNIAHNETEMAAWVYKNGPLSIAVDATTWQSYTGGILTNCAHTQLDHGVLIVGFDDAHSPPYWIIKNSWGAFWGEEGYLRVQKGQDECLITEYPCTSIVGPTDAPTPMPPSPPVTPRPPSPPISSQWIDLFQPPYQGVPGVSMAISCVDGTNCFVPGGQSGSGFDMFLFDGHREGTFTPLEMPDKALMMMAVGMGGTKDAPHGSAGGIGIGSGLQYAVNKSVFDASSVPTLFVETQDIRASSTGMDVIAVLDAHVVSSKDGGKTFAEHSINSVHSQCATGRYAAMVSDKEWFVTLGSWSSSNSKKAGEKALSERVSVVNGKRISHRMAKKDYSKVGGDDSCNYTAVIAKTTDGGATFTNVFEDLTANATFYFNGIDCSSPTNCVAVAEGFNADAAARIFHSADGKTFTEVLKLASSNSAMYSLMSVRFKTGNEVWVAGSKQDSIASTAVFYSSTDGGKTWTDKSGTLNNIGDISDISFTPDGKHGFATAVTVYDDSTILRYGAALPPAPPAPPTTGPTGTFIQTQCQDTNCSIGCQGHEFQTGVCMPLNGGGSAIASCTPTSLEQKIYADSPSCTGTVKLNSSPLNKCLQDNQGTSFENSCQNNGPSTTAGPTSSAGPTAVPVPTTAAPSTGTLIQSHCTASNCSGPCQNGTFATGTCLPMNGGGSAIVQCTANSVTETIYTSSSDCTGASQSGSMPLNQCAPANGGGYLENFCVKAFEAAQYAQGDFLVQVQATLRI